MLYDQNYTDYLGSFLMMPKSGEVYYTDTMLEINGFLMNQKSRTRCIMKPPKDGFGPM